MSYKQSHALLVAIDKYQNMSKLSTAVYGAEAFAELLSTTFEFQVTKFFNQNATEKNIIDWCRNLKCDKDDRVIFYFAGHGITRKSGSDEKGYLALFDSILEQYHTSLWIDSVINELDSLTAKHILIILDACFSGIVLQQSFITYRSADVTKESEEIYVNKLMNEQVRYVITAGRIELVDDNASPDGKMSLFTHFMLSGLRGDINTFSGLLTATELAVYIRNSVGNTNSAEHLPDFGHLRSSNRGEFIFRLPAAYVDIGSINSCNVEDGRSLLSNDEKLILEKLKRTKNLTVEEQITIGQSGSSVYLVNTVGYNPTAINGYHFCKVYRTITGEEAEIHKSVAKTSIGKYIPRLVDSTPHLDGWMASLYEVANQTTLRGSQSLSTLIKNNFVAARDTIVKLLNLLEIWNPLEKLVTNGSSSSPHSLLLRPLQRYTVANDSTDIDIVQRISYFVPEMVIDTLSISVERYILPNPVAYFSRHELWTGSRSKIYWPCGNIHGDLHTNNILCRIDSHTDTISGDPTIIDFDTYESDGNILYDLAYLELDIAMRMYSPSVLMYSENRSDTSSSIAKEPQRKLLADYREYWPRLSEFLARDLLLPPWPPLSSDSFAMYSLIAPIRESVAKMCSKRQGDFEVAYWIARTSAALSFARKRKLNAIDRKVAILLAAHSLDKALHELGIAHDYYRDSQRIQWFD